MIYADGANAKTLLVAEEVSCPMIYNVNWKEVPPFNIFDLR